MRRTDVDKTDSFPPNFTNFMIGGRTVILSQVIRRVQKQAILTKAVNKILSNWNNNNKTHVAMVGELFPCEQNHFLLPFMAWNHFIILSLGELRRFPWKVLYFLAK